MYGHSKQSMIVMEVAAKDKEAKSNRDRMVSESASAKAQLTAANALLDKYRARYPDLEEKKVDASEQSSTTAFSYSSLEAGEFVEKFATSYDGPEKGDQWNSDGANEIIEKAEKRN